MQTPISKFTFPQKSMTILVAVVFFTANTAWAVYSAFSFQPSPLFIGLYSITIASAFAFWVDRDSRSNQSSFGLDQAMFIFFGWPILFPVYIFRAYGFRHGILILLTFLGIYILTILWMFFLVIILIIIRTILAGG